MKKIEVVNGTEFGDLKVICELDTKGKRHFKCQCKCGNTTKVRLDHLRSGATNSCGSCGIEYMGKRKTLVGWADSIGVPESTFRARLKVMSFGEALQRGRSR